MVTTLREARAKVPQADIDKWVGQARLQQVRARYANRPGPQMQRALVIAEAAHWIRVAARQHAEEHGPGPQELRMRALAAIDLSAAPAPNTLLV